MKRCDYALLAAIAAIAAGCALERPDTRASCRSDRILIEANVDGGRLSDCSITGASSAELVIRPEDPPPINPSPWYQFRVYATAPGPIRLTLDFPHGYPRYWPKVSRNGSDWQAVDAEDLTVDEQRLTLALAAGPEGITVAAQPPLLDEWYEAWFTELEAHPETSVELIGATVAGRPLYGAKTTLPRDEFVLLLGRQHPPETTGAIAMRRFVERVFADDELARRFRNRFQLLIVPFMNPDGVANGHWRHNLGDVDLNRDWGPFGQPETRHAMAWVESTLRQQRELRLMLDFHSTKRNVFYTQTADESTLPFDFATRWLTRASERLPHFEFGHDANPVSDQANAKNYFYSTFGIPAITYELGDTTPLAAIREVTPVFAEELMRTALELPPPRAK